MRNVPNACFLKSGTAIVAIASLALSAVLPPRQTHAVEPATMMAIVSAASSALSLMNRGPDLTLTTVMENYKLLLEVHHRLDAIEASLGTLISQLSKLPAISREIIAQQLDRAEAEAVYNAPDTLRLELDQFGVLRGEDQKRLVLTRFALLRNSVERLRNRAPVAAALALAAASAIDLAYREALQQPTEQLNEAREYYREVLRALVDPRRPDSLVSLIRTLKNDKTQRQTAILARLNLTEIPETRRVVPWYSYVLQHRVKEQEQDVCYEVDPRFLHFESKDELLGKIIAISDDGARVSPGFLYPADLVRCWREVRVWRDKEPRCFWQTVESRLLGGSEVEIVVTPAESGGRRCRATPEMERHRGSPETYETAKQTELAGLIADVAVHNATSRALVALAALQEVIETAIAALDGYEPMEIYRLVRTQAHGADAAKRLAELREAGEMIEVQKVVEAMQQRREKAHATISQSRARIREVLEDQKSRQALGRTILGLQILATSMRIHMAVSQLVEDVSRPEPEMSTGVEESGIAAVAEQRRGGEAPSAGGEQDVVASEGGPLLAALPIESRLPIERMHSAQVQAGTIHLPPPI